VISALAFGRSKRHLFQSPGSVLAITPQPWESWLLDEGVNQHFRICLLRTQSISAGKAWFGAVSAEGLTVCLLQTLAYARVSVNTIV